MKGLRAEQHHRECMPITTEDTVAAVTTMMEKLEIWRMRSNIEIIQ